MKNKNSITMVMEETYPIDYNSIKILEQTTNEVGTDKVIFKVPLQDAEKINGNRRYYSKTVCNNIVNMLKPIAENRCLFQEIDHPMTSDNDKDYQRRRAFTVELKNSGSLISDIYMDGNNIYGVVESLSGFRGPDLRDLILKDKANIGFSLRMFSKLEPHSSFEGVMEVKSPLQPITYDVVTNPSHKVARIVQFSTEGEQFRQLMENNEDILVSESNEFLELDNIKNPYKSKTIIAEYLNELVRESFDDLRNLTFKIG